MNYKTIYFDNAATTFPKPPSVIRAVNHALNCFGNPGRGSHALAMRAAEEIYACRKAAAELFGASAERVIFTSGATHSLNLAINSSKTGKGAILISDLEHNAVARPAYASGKEVRVFPSMHRLCGIDRNVAILTAIDSISNGADTLVTTAASNICGIQMPIADIGDYCRSRGILFIVDGAQAGGSIDIDIKRDNIDVLCLPAHKGLYGPMGCGILILGENVSLEPFMSGGSGVNSQSKEMPLQPPERYEAGTLPAPLIAGLRRGIEFVKRKTPAAIRAHEIMLSELLTSELQKSGIHVYCPEHAGSTVLFNIDGMTPEEVSEKFDAHRICTRPGLHCAPLAHSTLESNGAVRISFGAFNTEKEVLKTAQLAREFAKYH